MSVQYELVKTVHVLSACVLVGTGAGIAFFCWHGSRSAIARGDIGALRLVLRLTVLADTIFTAPAVVIQVATGLWLMRVLGWRLASPWSVAAIGLFTVIGLCWLPVIRFQIVLHRMAQGVDAVDALPTHFHALFRQWFALGVAAFASIVAMLYLMVAKPLPVA